MSVQIDIEVIIDNIKMYWEDEGIDDAEDLVQDINSRCLVILGKLKREGGVIEAIETYLNVEDKGFVDGSKVTNRTKAENILHIISSYSKGVSK